MLGWVELSLESAENRSISDVFVTRSHSDRPTVLGQVPRPQFERGDSPWTFSRLRGHHDWQLEVCWLPWCILPRRGQNEANAFFRRELFITRRTRLRFAGGSANWTLGISVLTLAARVLIIFAAARAIAAISFPIHSRTTNQVSIIGSHPFCLVATALATSNGGRSIDTPICWEWARVLKGVNLWHVRI